MRILLATFDAYSHVTQAIPLVQRLVVRGHTVRWLVHERFRSRVHGAGAIHLRTSTPSHEKIPAMSQAAWVQMFGIEAMTQAADMIAALEDEPADVLLVDPTQVGVSAVTPGYPDTLPGLFGCIPLLSIPNEVDFVLQASLPQMELPIPTQHQSRVACIGPLLAPPAPGEPAAPEIDPAVPLVVVTQGTLATDPATLILPALEALADLPVQVLATCALKAVPKNARCVPWIPFHRVLPRAACVVSSAGFATMQWCAASGVPMVAAGETEDKPDVGARVEWSGLGMSLCGSPIDPATIREAVTTVLMNPRYRAEAQRLSTQCRLIDAATAGATIIEWARQRAVPAVEVERAA